MSIPDDKFWPAGANFGRTKMTQLSNFARNFAKRKNGQHSKFRKEFREICVLAGTDYNIGTSFTLPKTVKLYEKFKKNTTIRKQKKAF